MYRFTLQPYKGMNSRYTCPECNHKHTFTRYIDQRSGTLMPAHVGRCSREVKCGYHYKPKDYYSDTGTTASTAFVIRPRPVRRTSFIDYKQYAQSFAGYAQNNFVQFLYSRLGRDAGNMLVNRYHIGTSKHWQGSTVFWQMDSDNKVRTGKIMLYDATTGKRVKEPVNHVSWAHTVLGLPDYQLRQCLFGEHLLGNAPKQVAIVESEKTAIIASAYLPQFTWLACGSLSGLSVDKFRPLAGHHVTLFPDLNCYDKWKEKAALFSIITPVNISHLLELKATPEEREKGLDLADYLLRYELATFNAAE